MPKHKPAPRVVKRRAPEKPDQPVGAWKLAYADFMTALMAFFLLLWIVSSASNTQRAGIAAYFSEPVRIPLWGGDRDAIDTSAIKGAGGGLSTDGTGVTHLSTSATDRAGQSVPRRGDAATAASESPESIEQARLRSLQLSVLAAIEANPELRPFRQQIRIDSTQQGLRIEIRDAQNRPMFATASDAVEPYMRDILQAIGRSVNSVPNRIIIQGHTDAVPYSGGEKNYSNWELSTARANASRRELIAAGMDQSRVLRIAGLASSQSLSGVDPLAAGNRRISIIVLSARAEAALVHDDTSATTITNDAAGTSDENANAKKAPVAASSMQPASP
ncbi:flagellar motor protein MotB [Paraburkholderia caballeronis]|uniref:flagellar motor protein MotB n=1 Tax=Paraburkholderia caballeronis TaxID=416943 RepID=UPI00106658AF|nr:flagellar motor protein MotB [Paraburkholderia caballeronis]TDV06794.1 chemotaxis protein MotB [Paraburkholderia caballeronis]TDV09974.1 chemotaxis protein MotB [Paraburkholderia caballeronis]TDV21806.1 chemotaxis protein MotB [Paraburkholderia caballeronis]